MRFLTRKKRLYLLSGLGDRDWLLRWTLPLWRLFGFDPIVWPMQWEGPNAPPFDVTLTSLLAEIDSVPANVLIYIIGNSAGGVVAALVALLRRNRIARAIAVASPLNQRQLRRNDKLDAALAKLQDTLQEVGQEHRTHIASFHGWYDGVVPAAWSILPGGSYFTTPGVGHALTIALSHSLFCGRLVR